MTWQPINDANHSHSSRLIPARPAARLVVTCLIFLVFVPLGCGARGKTPPPTKSIKGNDPKQDLQAAIAAKNWSAALDVSQQALITYPDDADVLTHAAIATAQTGDRVKAARLLVDAARVSGHGLQEGRIDNAVAALLDVGYLYDAIDLLRSAVEAHPDATAYRRRLVDFLGEAQLTEEADRHMQRLIQQRQFDLLLLLATTETSARRYSKDSIELLRRRNPGDLRPRLGEAKQHLDQRDAASAESVLQEIIATHPEFAPAHAMLGISLVAQGKQESLSNWYRNAPQGTEDHSGYWYAVGNWALSQVDTEGAVRCLTEATRRAPNESSYWSALTSALHSWRSDHPMSAAIPYDEVIEAVVKRQTNLLALRDQFAAFKGDGQASQSLAFEVAKTLNELGRLWESEAWLAVATTLKDDPSGEVVGYRQQVMEQLAADRQWQQQRGHPEIAFDVAALSLPTDLLDRGQLKQTDRADSNRLDYSDSKPIRMRDATESLGLAFYGRVGGQVEGPRIPITQTLGCGGGVIDFDLDGHQDLLFAAAGGRIDARDSDRGALFRNLGTFADVTIASDFGDSGYSHGIVVGDYNDDGFADVLVLNLGPNRLLRNNGDGTFSDVSGCLGEQGAGQWSTSGAILDVNGDGYSDIVIVNYCDRGEPLEQPCFDSSGRQINCYPLKYRAAQDQILAGQGDGSFADMTAQWIGDVALGRGLGIVAGRLDGREPCLYIVNDASPNTFLRWRPDAGRFVDLGIASGLAVDGQSLDQGSMGIASGDFDLDGDVDFYVTGFANEYNILYEQQSAGFWVDRTASCGLVAPTLRTVGFGSEAIDLDHDGIVEIAVTNGHVGIFAPPLPPYAQPFQLFRRSDAGGYQAADVASWGGYFSLPHVGRGLFTGDINDDGRCDVVVTHATEPVALLLNDSDRSNHRFSLRLIDPVECRDAVGAIVEFELGETASPTRRVLHQLGGHGYLCSNQPTLWAGTGSTTRIRNVQVTWPDGTKQPVGDIDTDAGYLLVRGESPHLLKRFDQP